MNKNNDRLYDHYRQHLSKMLLFRDLSRQKLEELLHYCHAECWEKGTYKSNNITEQSFYIIIKGRIELISSHAKTGKQYTLKILKAGDVYDVFNLLDSKNQILTPVALDRLQVLTASISDIRRWILNTPCFNQSLLRYITQHVRHLEQVASDLALLEISARLARVIYRHTSSDYLDDYLAHGIIEVELLRDLSNEQLARLTGSVRQVINKHLRIMSEEGIVEYRDGYIFIRNLELLEEKGQLR